MFKTICLFALIALAVSQDPAQVVSEVTSVVGDPNAVATAVNNAVGGTTVDQAAQNAVGTVQQAAAATGVDIATLPTLSSVTVGWGPREVVVTPQNANPTNNDWFASGETLNVEQVQGVAADGEWTLNWSVENGDDWALWNNNGDLQIVDWVNGEVNVVADLGENAALDAEIALATEQVVDYVWNNDVTTVNTDDVASGVNNIVNQVWTNQNLQGFLSNQGQSGQTTVGEVVQGVINNPQGALDNAVATAESQGVNVPAV